MRLMLTSFVTLGLAAPAAIAEPVFNRISSFPTTANFAEGEDRTQETSAEIMAVTGDGNTLIYSDSPLEALGLIDISDPAAPMPLGHIAMDGEPSTTVIVGGTAFVGVNTSDSFTEPSGALRSVDIASQEITASCDIGGQPDSVAINGDGSQIAIAIENERDEDVNDGVIPQMPAGFVVTIPVADGTADCAGLKRIELTGLAELAGSDPEPEFVSYNEAGELAVTLQENNHIAIIGADGEIAGHFSAGSVDLDGIDTEDDGQITPTASLSEVPREPDAVAWLDNDHLVTANEGDWNGGSHGFTIWGRDGSVVYDSGNLLDHELMKLGHYPDGRSDNKGGEPEAVITAQYDDTPMIFVASERGSIVFVFDASDPAAPRLVQALPSGVGPEGLVAIPQRNLFATANETDLGEDGGPRAHVMLYERKDTPAAYPTITSAGADELIPWGALSGLAVDPTDPARLYAVSDSFYSAAPAIFAIDASQSPARITSRLVVSRDGAPAEKLDLEGIEPDGQGGFWLASEGNSEKDIPHAVLHVDAEGAITGEFGLPEALAEHEKRFGFEGIALAEGKLWLAVQREWGDDPEGQVKLLQLDPASGEWSGLRYPIETGEGWVGLSDLAVHEDALYLIERDNLIGGKAALKQITRVDLAGLQPAPLDGDLPLVDKEIVRDLIPDLNAPGGYVQDKVEGLAITPEGTAHVVTDNDGVDDSSGETHFWSFQLN
ncbi:esterase-like activity of phytase family protein [Paracoccus methylarcula]|uniref:Esterase-like activity of phytase family protein n=1 Tax=Paracoccus methylarcula TaxID=72022 RepID=A0A3R7P3T3_9RHOB|nr:esterase-like activity of phytase family protein [Paracoccus methylarcula]RNF33930.1 esterase-like activity of phytase family protein [Paracoccus methylarcula]